MVHSPVLILTTESASRNGTRFTFFSARVSLLQAIFVKTFWFGSVGYGNLRRCQVSSANVHPDILLVPALLETESAGTIYLPVWSGCVRLSLAS